MGEIADLTTAYVSKKVLEVEELLREVQDTGRQCDPETAIELSWSIRSIAQYQRDSVPCNPGPLLAERLKAFGP